MKTYAQIVKEIEEHREKQKEELTASYKQKVETAIREALESARNVLIYQSEGGELPSDCYSEGRVVVLGIPRWIMLTLLEPLREAPYDIREGHHNCGSGAYKYTVLIILPYPF